MWLSRRASAASALLVAKTCINLVIKVFCLVRPGQLQIDFKERKFNHKIELVLVCGTYMYRYMQEEIGCPHNMRERMTVDEKRPKGSNTAET